MGVIEIVFLLLGGGLLTVTFLRYLKLPTLFGYLILGMSVGPHGMDLIATDTDVTQLAELGIMALMFTLGLKFSITRLMNSKRLVLMLGGLQFGVCLGIAAIFAVVVLGIDALTAVLIGSIVAMSSTAIVSKMLIERGEVTTPHGTRMISVLIFQDLAVIPLLILFSREQVGSAIWINLLQAVGLIAVLVVVAPRVMPAIVNYFARIGSSEVFTLFVLFFIVGASLLTYSTGLSLVLGSFVAGMLLSESHHRYHIEEIIRPYSEIFLGFFFVSIGLLIVPGDLYAHWAVIIAVTGAVLVCKPLVIYALVRLLRTHQWTAAYTAAGLSGTGEFGFVLLAAAASNADAQILQILLGINLLCMLAPALLIPLVERLRAKLFGHDWLLQARDLTKIISQAATIRDHVILCGFGQNAKVVCNLLDRQNIPWLAIENNNERAQAGAQGGKNVVYGDARNTEILIAAGLISAKALLITHGLQAQTAKTVYTAHRLNPKIAIIAKARGSEQAHEISAAGATHVITSAIETGTSLAVRAMQIYGVDGKAIMSEVYALPDTSAEKDNAVIASLAAEIFSATRHDAEYAITQIDVAAGDQLDGVSEDKLAGLLAGNGVKVVYVQRDGQNIQPGTACTLQPGDVLFLEGNSTQVATVSASLSKK